MAQEKIFTAKQAAKAVLEKVGKLLKGSTAVNAPIQNTQDIELKQEFESLSSLLKSQTRALGIPPLKQRQPKDPLEADKKIIAKLPKPTLDKSEEAEESRDQKIRRLQKSGFSPNQIEAELKKGEGHATGKGGSPLRIGHAESGSHEGVNTGIGGVSDAGVHTRLGNPGKAKDKIADNIMENRMLPNPKLGKSETKHDRCVEHVKENSPGVENPHAVCVAQGVKPSAWKKSELEGDLENLDKLLKGEGYKPQNAKKENAKPSEHGSKDADQHAEGDGPKGEIKPDEKEQAPLDGTRTQTDPMNNPKEKAEGNNELAGTTPTQVGLDGKNKPGYDEMKGHIKLAKFLGMMEGKRLVKSKATMPEQTGVKLPQ
ncbi:hypothetical protein CCP1ISM_130005 [Azospirillaceae bacterium]